MNTDPNTQNDNQDEQNVGVGTPNIGVEKVAPQPGIPPLAIDKPEKPTTPPAPQNQNPDNADIEVELDPKPNTIQVKHYGQEEASEIAPAPPEEIQPKNDPLPPVKASTGPGARIVLLTLLALVLGSAGGFFGYRYYDQVKTTASTPATPTPSQTPSLDTNLWPIYTNTTYKFSLKFPNGWVASTTDPAAESVTFTSNEESLTQTPTGYKIEVVFQDSNGKTLKAWVDDNTITLAETKKPKEIQVSEGTAYQQELSKNGSKIATYIERPNKIMIVTYSAPENLFGQGGDWYNNLINSIKLL